MGSVSDDEVIKLYDPVFVMGLLVVANFRVVVGFVVVYVVAFVVVVSLCIALCGKAFLIFRKTRRAKIFVNSLIENILVEYFIKI